MRKRVGENNYRYVRKDGYVVVYYPEHPRASSQGWVLEHILVVESAMKKFLRVGAEVHHINEIRSDNRPQNLVVCEDSTYHKLLHKRKAALLACGNLNWKRCKYCGKHDDPIRMRKGSPSGGFEHRDCKLAHRRAKYTESRV